MNAYEKLNIFSRATFASSFVSGSTYTRWTSPISSKIQRSLAGSIRNMFGQRERKTSKIFLSGCSSDPTGTTGTSASGYSMAIRANPGEVRSNGTDSALVVVEVWDENGNYVTGETVTFSVSLGTLANSTVTTANGVAVNTFTSSATSDGMAIITAAVENIVAKAEIVLYYTSRD